MDQHPLDAKIAEWAAARNYPQHSATLIVAPVNGCNIGFAMSTDKRGYFVSLPVTDDGTLKEKFKAFKKQAKSIGRVTLVVNKYIQMFIVRPAMGRKEKIFASLDAAVDTFSVLLPQCGIIPAQTCYYCGAPGCDTNSEVEGVLYPVHAGCREAHLQNLLHEVQDNQANGSYLLGALCALLGGIVGAIPSIVVLFFLDVYSAWLFILIPLAASYGYKLGKGKRTGVMMALITLVTLLCTAGIFFTYLYVLATFTFGFMSMDLYFALIMEGDVLLMLIQMLAFAVIGLFICWRSISNTNKKALAKAQAMYNENTGR